MKTIGLTGGPGVGKTEVAQIFAERGAIIISGDKIGREVVDTIKSIKIKLMKEFGADIFDTLNNLNRSKLGKLAFKSQEKLVKLNKIVHPPLLKLMKNRISQARKKSPKKLIIIDAALIYEWAIAYWFDYMVVINSKRMIRIARMTKLGLSKRQAEQRISSQIPQRTKMALADYVIENNGTKSSLRKKVNSLIDSIENSY